MQNSISDEPNKPATPPSLFSWWTLAALVVIAATLAFKLAVVLDGGFDLSFDEAYYWHWSKNLDWCYFSKGPGIALMIRATTALLGDTDFAIRAGALTVSTLTLVVLYFWTTQFFACPRSGFLTVLLVSASPFLMGLGMLTTIDSPLILLWALSTFFLWKGLETGRFGWWLGLGLAMAAGTQFKFTMLLYLASVVVCLLFDRMSGRRVPLAGPLVALALPLISLVPILIWNIQRDWITVGHTVDKASTNDQTSLITFRYLIPSIAQQLGIMSPVLGVGTIWAGYLLIRHACGFGKKDAELLDPRHARFLLGVSLPLILLYGVLAFHRMIEANWVAVIYVTLLPAAAYYWIRPFRPWQQVTLALALMVGWIIQAPLLGGDRFYELEIPQRLEQAGIPFRASFDLTNRLIGRKELGELVAQRIKEVEAKTGRPAFCLTEHYSFAAWIGYYGKMPDRVFVIPSAVPRNQFDMWAIEGRLPPPGAAAVLAYDSDKGGRGAESIFASLDPFEPAHPVTRASYSLRHYLFRTAYDYLGTERWIALRDQTIPVTASKADRPSGR